MIGKKIAASLFILFVVTLAGCMASNPDSLNYPTYENVISELQLQQGTDDLLKLISFEKEGFNIETENELEQRLNFSFLIKNVTDKTMKVSYVGYFPKELDQYYLSRFKIELEQVDLKPNQIIDATQSILVAHEENLSTIQSQFLQQNGHVMYFAISLNGKLHYLEVKLNELGYYK